jgi:trans-aconitate methyltransferase
MDNVESSKSFAPIHDDYAFFQEHSTEAEADLSSHLHYILPLVKSGKAIHLLDFGCGDGLFTHQLLARARFDPSRLNLSLVEPDSGYQHQARTRLQVFTSNPISSWPSIPPEQENSFDLILANHVLYYVKNLADILGQLLEAQDSDSCFLISMAGLENVLMQIIYLSFASLLEPMPYYQAEDIEITLVALKQQFQKKRIDYEVNFPDKEENRLKMFRFLLGENFERMDREKIVRLFDPYVVKRRIIIQTYHYQFVIKNYRMSDQYGAQNPCVSQDSRPLI